jgi:DNA-binding transcriptional ArsR family regulator
MMLKLDEEEKRFIEAIGNPSRLKILLTLWKSDKELTVYKICQRTGLGRSAAARHLHKLVVAELVSRKIYGEITLYSINRNDSRARTIVELLVKAIF